MKLQMFLSCKTSMLKLQITLLGISMIECVRIILLLFLPPWSVHFIKVKPFFLLVEKLMCGIGIWNKYFIDFISFTESSLLCRWYVSHSIYILYITLCRSKSTMSKKDGESLIMHLFKKEFLHVDFHTSIFFHFFDKLVTFFFSLCNLSILS